MFLLHQVLFTEEPNCLHSAVIETAYLHWKCSILPLNYECGSDTKNRTRISSVKETYADLYTISEEMLFDENSGRIAVITTLFLENRETLY